MASAAEREQVCGDAWNANYFGSSPARTAAVGAVTYTVAIHVDAAHVAQRAAYALGCIEAQAGRADDPEEGELVEWQKQRELLRCIFGNPFRLLPPLGPALLHGNGGAVAQLARAAYEERSLPEGLLDPGRLAVLADALEEGGCTSPEILAHLRAPGPHVRGCWIVDLLLNKA
jgi:hypothetical protein